MSDVDLTTSVDASGAAAGFAELANYAEKARADITRSFARDIGGLAIFSALTAGIKSVIDYGARVDNLSERFAVSRQVIQQWGNVAEQKGSSLEGVAMGFNRLEIAQSKAIGGSQSMIDAFGRLGVSLEDLETLSADQIVLKIGKGSMDAADMVKVFGKNALSLIPTFRDVANGTAPLGKAMDDNLIIKLHEADDTIKRFSQTARIGFGQIAGWLDDSFRGLTALGQALTQPFSTQGRADLAAGKSWANETLTPDTPASFQMAKAATGRFLTPEARAAMRALESPGSEGGAAVTGVGDIDQAVSNISAAASGKLESLRDRITKAEEAGAAQNRSDEEQLNVLRQKGVELTNDMLTAQGHIGGEVDDQKTQLEAELAVAENNAAMAKLQQKIDDDRATTIDKITKEREKEAQAAEQGLAAAQESNKELQLELSGRKDLADRAKIEYDYAEKIHAAKNAISEAEKNAQAAREAGDEADAQAYQNVIATNNALVTQLSLEEKNALAVHDKAEAEKQAAVVVEAKSKLSTAEESLATTDERAKELQLQLAGRTGRLDLVKTELQYDKQITATANDANDLWQQMADAYARNNVAAGDILAKAAQLKDIETGRLESEKQMALLIAEQAAGLVALGREGAAGQVRQLGPGQSVAGYDQFGRPVVKGAGGPGSEDLTIGGLASHGLRMGSTAMGLALNAAGGDMNSAAYKTALAHYEALDQLANVTGKTIYSFIDLANAQAGLDAYGKQQTVRADAQAKKNVQDQITYWQDIVAGRTPPASNQFTKMYGAVPGLEGTRAPGTPGVQSLAYYNTQSHLPSLLGASVPNVAGSSTSMISKLEQQVSLLQQAVSQLTSIDGRLKPAVGSHG